MLETVLSGLVNMMSRKVLVGFSAYLHDVSWDVDECVKFWGQKVKVTVE